MLRSRAGVPCSGTISRRVVAGAFLGLSLSVWGCQPTLEPPSEEPLLDGVALEVDVREQVDDGWGGWLRARGRYAVLHRAADGDRMVRSAETDVSLSINAYTRPEDGLPPTRVLWLRESGVFEEAHAGMLQAGQRIRVWMPEDPLHRNIVPTKPPGAPAGTVVILSDPVDG